MVSCTEGSESISSTDTLEPHLPEWEGEHCQYRGNKYSAR